MAKGFAKVPKAPRYVLANATLPAVLVDGFTAPADEDGLIAADITVRNGIIERIDPPGRRTRLPKLDLDRGMVWPCFVDMHTHLDKGHIWPRRRNPDGTFMGALEAVATDREMHWRPHDVERRMDFALRAAYAHGTALLRTHLDSGHPQHLESWPAFGRMREKWAGRIDLQAVSLFAIDHFANETYANEIVDLVAEHGGVLGAVTFMMPGLEDADREDDGPRRRTRPRPRFPCRRDQRPASALAAHHRRYGAETGFPGRITCGHCCSLAVQPDAEAEETLDRVAQAGIAVVSLPMCNMYLQDRVSGRTPRWRGITLLHEFTGRGTPVAVASDNTRDPFYAYGDLDMVEVFREAVRIAHFDHPFGAWPATVARGAAEIIGRPDRGVVAPGLPADLVLFSARSFTELNARPQADRTVLRAGTADRPHPARLPGARRHHGESMSAYDIDALKQRLDGIKVEDHPAIVKQKSRDFYWYSPILKRQLDAVTGDVLVSPKSEAEVIAVLKACYRARHSRHPARHRHRQLRPGHAAFRRSRAQPRRDECGEGDFARPRRQRTRRRHHLCRQGDPRRQPPGAAPAPLDRRHGDARRLHRRRLRRRRLDQLGGLAQYRQCAWHAHRHHGGRAARAPARRLGPAQGDARLRHQRHHHRGRHAARCRP